MIEIPETILEYLDNIYLDPSNPNVMSKEQLSALKESMLKYGAIVPIIIDQDNMIIDGHQRKQVAEELGLKQYPCVKINTTKLDAKLLKQILNKLKGTHDLTKDQEEYKFILEEDGSLDLLKKYVAMDDEFLRNIQRDIENPLKDKTDDELDEVPEVEHIKTDIKYGDIFQLGRHRIMAGDSTKKEDVDKLINGKKASIGFTSPPYNVGHNLGYEGKDSKYIQKDDNNEYLQLLIKSNDFVLNNATYSFFNLQMLANNKNDIIEWLYYNNKNFCDIAFWKKLQVAPSMASNVMNSQVELIIITSKESNNRAINTGNFRGNLSNIIETKSASHENEHSDIHNATFPLTFVSHFVDNFTQVNDIVLDCFIGLGTTLIACEKTDRVCYGMELSEKYCEVICQRYEKLTGNKRVKLNE